MLMLIIKTNSANALAYAVRNRWQTQGDEFAYKMTLRQKFALDYNIRKTKLAPSIATEYFLNLEDGINKLRSTIALGYPLG